MTIPPPPYIDDRTGFSRFAGSFYNVIGLVGSSNPYVQAGVTAISVANTLSGLYLAQQQSIEETNEKIKHAKTREQRNSLGLLLEKQKRAAQQFLADHKKEMDAIKLAYNNLNGEQKRLKNDLQQNNKHLEQCTRQSAETTTQLKECNFDLEKAKKENELLKSQLAEVRQTYEETQKAKEALEEQDSWYKGKWHALSSLALKQLKNWATSLSLSGEVKEFIHTFFFVLLMFVGVYASLKVLIFLKDLLKRSEKDKQFKKHYLAFKRSPTLRRFGMVYKDMKRLAKTPKEKKLLEELSPRYRF